MSNFFKTCVPLCLGLMLTACSQKPYEPIIDGPVSDTYEQDLAECRKISEQKKTTGANAAASGVSGGLWAGIFGGSTSDIVASVVVGSAIGAADESAQVKGIRDRLVFRCLRGRGHNVIG